MKHAQIISIDMFFEPASGCQTTQLPPFPLPSTEDAQEAYNNGTPSAQDLLWEKTSGDRLTQACLPLI